MIGKSATAPGPSPDAQSKNLMISQQTDFPVPAWEGSLFIPPAGQHKLRMPVGGGAQRRSRDRRCYVVSTVKRATASSFSSSPNPAPDGATISAPLRAGMEFSKAAERGTYSNRYAFGTVGEQLDVDFRQHVAADPHAETVRQRRHVPPRRDATRYDPDRSAQCLRPAPPAAAYNRRSHTDAHRSPPAHRAPRSDGPCRRYRCA